MNLAAEHVHALEARVRRIEHEMNRTPPRSRRFAELLQERARVMDDLDLARRQRPLFPPDGPEHPSLKKKG